MQGRGGGWTSARAGGVSRLWEVSFCVSLSEKLANNSFRISCIVHSTCYFMASIILAQKKQNKKTKTEDAENKKEKRKKKQNAKKWRRVSQRVALEFSKRLNYVVLSRYSNARIPCSLCITCHCLLMLKNFTLINVLTM